MSTSGTSSSGSTMSPTTNLNAIIHPSLNSVLIGHTFLTLLVPLLIALFYFSTPQSRRRPLFVLNVIAIAFAFTAGVMIDALAIHTILSPLSPWTPSVNIAIGLIGAFQSILVDTILLVRLISVHPLNHVGPRRFALLTSIPILLKIARLTNLIIFTKVLADAAQGPLLVAAQKVALKWATTPYLKIEWSAQMADNAYASLAFLWTIRDRGNRQGVTSNIHPHRVTFAQRMRTLSRIALSNFIIPTLFSIAQLVVVYRNVNVVIINDIVLANSMLAVFGVVFATVWAGNVGRRDAEEANAVAVAYSSDRSKKTPKGYSIPGLGAWRVASTPPTMTFGSSGYTGPTMDRGRDEKADPEKGNGGGLAIISTREVAGSSTPSL